MLKFKNKKSDFSKSSIEEQKKIPIIVGVTGHRNILGGDKGSIERSIITQLKILKETYPYSDIVMLNTLTHGGDTLSALCARELNIKLICPLPFSVEEYRKDFSDEDLIIFNELLDYADDAFIVPNTEEIPEDADREFYYRQVGIYIASHSHLLLALWDGGDLGHGSCGTSKMIDLMLNGTYLPENGKTMYTGENEAVLHIYAPHEVSLSRDGVDDSHDSSGYSRGIDHSFDDSKNNVGEVRWLGNIKNFKYSLEKTDEFNRLLDEKKPENDYELLPSRDVTDSVIDDIEYFFNKADSLSMNFQDTYRTVLAALAILGTAITLAFLLYEKLEIIWLIVVCGIMLIFAGVVLYYAKKSDCHSHYIEYRTLAEGLRVQAFLRYAGSSLQASELFTWSQQLEKAWIMKALRALSIGPLPRSRNDIVDCWIRDQKIYHKNASKKVKNSYTRSERNLDIAIILSVLLYVAAFVFEITAGGLTQTPLFRIDEPESYRIVIAIALGTISAGTLFIANFYGKQSLSRKAFDHEKMAIFYERMESQLIMFGQTDELLRYIAHEELIENSNWSSYQSDNEVDLEIG